MNTPNLDKKELAYSLRLLADSPIRPVDWRWRLCELALGMETKAKIPMDYITRKAYQFIKHLNQLLNKYDPMTAAIKLNKKYPDFTAAWQIANDLDAFQSSIDLQCALLARMEPEYAVKFKLTPKAIQLYHDLFFDVTSELANPHYIVHFAIFQEKEPYSLIDRANRDRFLSYFCGAEAAKYCRLRLRFGDLQFEDGRPTSESLKRMTQYTHDNLTIRLWGLSESEISDPILLKLYTAIKEVNLEALKAAGISETASTLLGYIQWELKARKGNIAPDEGSQQLSQEVFGSNK